MLQQGIKEFFKKLPDNGVWKPMKQEEEKQFLKSEQKRNRKKNEFAWYHDNDDGATAMCNPCNRKMVKHFMEKTAKSCGSHTWVETPTTLVTNIRFYNTILATREKGCIAYGPISFEFDYMKVHEVRRFWYPVTTARLRSILTVARCEVFDLRSTSRSCYWLLRLLEHYNIPAMLRKTFLSFFLELPNYGYDIRVKKGDRLLEATDKKIPLRKWKGNEFVITGVPVTLSIGKVDILPAVVNPWCTSIIVYVSYGWCYRCEKWHALMPVCNHISMAYL